MELKKFLKAAGVVLASAVGIWVFVAYLLPLTLPFLLSFFLAVVTEPAALFLMERGKLKRWAAGSICTIGSYILLFLLIFLVGRRLFSLLGDVTAHLPDALRRISPMLEHLQGRLLELTRRLPDGLGTGLSAAVEDFFRSGSGLLSRLPEMLLSAVTAFAGKLPGFAFFAVTTVVASFMVSAQLPRLRLWLSRVLPGPWRMRVTGVWNRIKHAGAGWFKAQGKLMGITFLLSLLGLFLLHVRRPLFTAAAITVVDALPVFGSGTVLIPWAVGCFLGGNTVRGVAFLLLYGVVAVTRATMEPRLMGRQMGLPPIATLASIYIGGKLCGIGGMLLFPVAASILGQLVRLRKG